MGIRILKTVNTMKPLLLLAAMIVGLATSASAQDTRTIIEGARLWADNCTRCHAARSPAERTDRQWTTIGKHMRARSNMTKSETKKIVAYLQAMNLPPATARVVGSERTVERGSVQGARER